MGYLNILLTYSVFSDTQNLLKLFSIPVIKKYLPENSGIIRRIGGWGKDNFV